MAQSAVKIPGAKATSGRGYVFSPQAIAGLPYDLQAGRFGRELDEDRVLEIAESVAEIGQQTPISVRLIAEDEVDSKGIVQGKIIDLSPGDVVIVSGRHRQGAFGLINNAPEQYGGKQLEATATLSSAIGRAESIVADIASNNVKSLGPMDLAQAANELAGLGWKNPAIGKAMSKAGKKVTAQRVKKLLELLSLPLDLQGMLHRKSVTESACHSLMELDLKVDEMTTFAKDLATGKRKTSDITAMVNKEARAKGRIRKLSIAELYKALTKLSHLPNAAYFKKFLDGHPIDLEDIESIFGTEPDVFYLEEAPKDKEGGSEGGKGGKGGEGGSGQSGFPVDDEPEEDEEGDSAGPTIDDGGQVVGESETPTIDPADEEDPDANWH